jgi:hypothetical protein
METLTEKNEKGGKMSKEEKTYNAAQAMAGNIIADFINFHIKRDNTRGIYNKSTDECFCETCTVERLWDSWDVFIDDEIWENSERSFLNEK